MVIPSFAPAWARLGRTCRVVGKYVDPEPKPAYDAAEKAFERALAINPELPVAHSLYSYLQVEQGKADEAMVRLLEQLRKHPANAELFASLVHACRYCGLLDASLAAHGGLRRATERGFFCYPAFARDSWLDFLRGRPEFAQLMREVETRHRAATAAFTKHGGERLLHL